MQNNSYIFLQLIRISLILYTSSIFANQNVNNKLSDVLHQIQSVKQDLSKHQIQKNNLQQQLRATELTINHLSQRLQKINTDLNLQEKAIPQLMRKQRRDVQRIKKQQQLLIQQIKIGYFLALNKKNHKILLEVNDINKIDRLLIYNHCLNVKRNGLITNLKQELLILERDKNSILKHANYLTDLKKNQLNQQSQLNVILNNRKKLLTNISFEVNNRTQQLDELLKNKKALENIIQHLQKKETYTSDYLNHHKGHFPWPTQGKLIENFGSYIQKSELKQTGLLIGAPEGQEVYAVAPGRVVFANWMPGYGLLMIIEHGKGYMTLYGNNGVLYKKEHDIVNNHELIATVGHTGGQQRSALYFALRYKGKPVDPGLWCVGHLKRN